jgi:hypothetical protein
MVYGCSYQEYQNIFSHIFVEYIIIPCTILSSFFVLFKFIIGINQKLLTCKTKSVKFVTLGTIGGSFMAPHSLPQPSLTLCSHTGPLQPLAASRSPTYGLFQLSEADTKNRMQLSGADAKKRNGWESNSRKKTTHSLKVHDANHYTTAPGIF